MFLTELLFVLVGGDCSLSDFELVHSIKRDLLRRRSEIDKMKSGKRKTKAMKIYADLLTSLELGVAS